MHMFIYMGLGNVYCVSPLYALLCIQWGWCGDGYRTSGDGDRHNGDGLGNGYQYGEELVGMDGDGDNFMSPYTSLA